MSCVYGVPVVSWTPMRMSGSSARLGVWFVVLVGNVCVCVPLSLWCVVHGTGRSFVMRCMNDSPREHESQRKRRAAENLFSGRVRIRGAINATGRGFAVKQLPLRWKLGTARRSWGGSGSRRRHLPSASGRAAALRRPALSSRCRCVFYYLNALFKLLT